MVADILECKVKWALGSINMNKISGGDEIPVELSQILKDTVALNMPNLENSAVAIGLENINFHSNSKKGNAKKCSNYCKIAFILYVSKLMLKILKARLQQFMN